MLEVFREPIVRLIFISVVISARLFRPLKRVDLFVLLFLVVIFLSDLCILFIKPNLFPLSILGMFQLAVILRLVHLETGNKKILWAILLPVALLLLYINTELYFLQSIIPVKEELKTKFLHFQQYLDLFGVINLEIIICMFYWLYCIVTRDDINSGNKKLAYILLFLLFYAGSFFNLVIGRFLLPNPAEWYELWSLVYFPLYAFLLISLSIALLWKPRAS